MDRRSRLNNMEDGLSKVSCILNDMDIILHELDDMYRAMRIECQDIHAATS